MNFLRFLMVLSIGLWVGGVVFLVIVAQVSFSTLPTTHLAGMVVRGSLIALHWIGLTCGLVYLIASFIEFRLSQRRVTVFRPNHIMVALMLALTAISQFDLIPRMDAIQEAAGGTSQMAMDSPLRKQFDFLHTTSTRVEEAVLLLGIIVLYLTTRRLASADRA